MIVMADVLGKAANNQPQSFEERYNKILNEEQARCKRYNDELGKLHLTDGVECPVCKNKGWKRVIIRPEHGFPESAMCKCPNCWEKRQKVRNAKDAGLGDDYGLKFSQYQVRYDWQKSAKEAAESYAVHLGHAESPKWLVLVGQVGSGKTMLASCAANALLRRGYKVKMKSWPEVVRYTSADYYKEKETLKEYQEAPVLYLDDLFKGSPTTREISLAYEIINYRYAHGMPTIITSEKSPEEMARIDEAIWSRIIQMTNPKGLVHIRKDVNRDQRRTIERGE